MIKRYSICDTLQLLNITSRSTSQKGPHTVVPLAILLSCLPAEWCSVTCRHFYRSSVPEEFQWSDQQTHLVVHRYVEGLVHTLRGKPGRTL